MDNIQSEIELLQREIEQANAAIAKAIQQRRTLGKDSPLAADVNAAIESARQALHLVEVKLRALYESKDSG